MMEEFVRQSVIVTCWILIVVNCDVVRNEDICGHHNGRRLYLELGEQGLLYAKNTSYVRNSGKLQGEMRQYMANNSHEQCSLELVTCPSCAIVVTFKSLNLPNSCNDMGVVMDSPCRCDYVWISEPPYDDISGTSFCGLYTPIVYRSSTRTVSITFLHSQSHKNAFVLEYVAERNRVHLKGSDSKLSKSNNETIGGILTSPFFPSRYPRDLGLEYVITCPSQSPSCRVRVLFSDFQLATVSIIEFYDWNGQRLDVSSGARFRPPIIVSSGPSLLIRFYANGGTGLGYKAFYSYVIGHLYENSVQPITDCGGYVENLGGTITMMDMVNQGVKTYDCVWLIRPPKNFLHMKTHMYIKVITFANMAGSTELIIRQGPTSALLPLEILRHPGQVQLARTREHIAPITSGFHVSLRGAFSSTSRVAIAYAAFGYMDCFSSSDFLCHNHRCIPSQLNCDGFDHCGDNSDEPATCFRTWREEPQDRKWHMNKANYYFPKIDRYPDLKTATLVFVASSLGLIILISALIILLYRMGARARQQRELQSRLQTISELLDSARIDEISVSDDPPMYEAPPGYDEVVKVGLENEVVSRRKKVKRKNERREPRSRSSPNQRIQSGSSETPQTVSNVRVPESPPPPYMTPPGTIPRNSTISRNNILHISVPLSFRNRSRRVWHRQSSLPGTDVSSVSSINAETVAEFDRCWEKYELRIRRKLNRARRGKRRG
uniref:NETO1_1 protein n=1 Tax=Fopius arisanus TaxID=64838 RepID=A0A0C9RJQ6_9HYME